MCHINSNNYNLKVNDVEDVYIIVAMPGSDITDICNKIYKLDARITAPKTTEQWELENTINDYDNIDIKIVVVPTPLDECIENNNNSENPISEDKMSYLYNHFIMTLGWLYENYSEKIINSTHL